MCPPDQTTFDYVDSRSSEPYEPVYADDNASYLQEYRWCPGIVFTIEGLRHRASWATA